ncbi:MAG: heparinase II/III family protein [Armatimonadetes bacterium]|nr:heparinase II/III family protein [Armatimonadota bacterium]
MKRWGVLAASAAAVIALCALGGAVINRPDGHPRIWITAADLPRLRALAADNSPNALGWVPAEECRKIVDRARELAAKGPYRYEVDIPGAGGGPSKHWEYTLSDEPPPRHDDTPHYPPWTAMFQERADSITTRIKYFTFAYLVTGEALFLEKAKEVVFHLCRWPIIWTDPSYGGGRPCLDTGHAAHAVGLFYDWCYDALKPDERALVREALVEKALVPIDQILDSVPDYHNYSAAVTMGLGTGALALLGEDERAEKWLDHCIAKVKRSFDVQGADGGPLEGPMYGTYFADSYAAFLWGLHSAGIKTDVWDHVFLKTLPRYCISMMAPKVHRLPTFGDGGATAAFPITMTLLALRGDTDAAWYLQQIGALRPSGIESLLLLDPAKIQPREPSWNPSSCFVDVGYASLRDGLREDAAYMAFKCGPPEKVVGHNHFDHNSFQICFNGEWLVSDPGYRSYFNPPANKYTTSALGHNTILLNLTPEWLQSTKYQTPGVDQMRLMQGRIVRFVTTPAYDYVRGDATETYNTDQQKVLSRFWRDVLFIKPRIFIVRDALSAALPSTFHYLLHAMPDRSLVANENRLCILAPNAALDASIFSPSGIGPWETRLYPGAESFGPYAVASTPRLLDAVITSVLVPRLHTGIVNGGFEEGFVGWTPRRMPGFTENHVIDDQVAHSGRRSGRIDAPGGYYYSVHFAAQPGQNIRASFWARVDAPSPATPCFYFWRDGKAFKQVDGPRPSGNEWREYSFQATVPEGTEEVCLALNFFSQTGRAWFDDVTVTVEPPAPQADAAVVTPLGDSTSGVVVGLGATHVVLFGPSGRSAVAHTVRGHRIAFSGEMCTVAINSDGLPASFFMLCGTRLEIDGQTVVAFDEPMTAAGAASGGRWKVETIERIEPALPTQKQ